MILRAAAWQEPDRFAHVTVGLLVLKPAEADLIGTCLKVLVRLEGAGQGVWQCDPELEASAPRQPVSSGCF